MTISKSGKAAEVVNLLLVEDSDAHAMLVEELLADAGVAVVITRATTLGEARSHLQGGDFHVILLDLNLPDSRGDATIKEISLLAPFVPIIILTSLDDEKLAMKAIRIGAQDYLVKGVADRNMLLRSIRYAIERKRAETELRHSEERYRTLIEAITDMVLMVDSEERIVSFNAAAVQSLRKHAGELIGTKQSDVFPQDIAKLNRTHIGQVFSTGLPYTSEDVQEIRQGTERRWVERTLYPVRGVSGDVIAVIIISRDVTDRSRREEEQERLRRLEAIGTLAGGIAHDFNNLLAAILGNIGFVKMLVPSQEKPLKLLSDAEVSINQAKDLSYKLLTFSKGGTPIRQEASIAEIVRMQVNDILSNTGIAPEFVLPESLSRVKLDKDQFMQVVMNITNNAAAAMPNGGRYRVAAEDVVVGDNSGVPAKPGRYVRISFEDSGFGIPPEHLPKIFDPYFTTKDTYSQKGLGLGLAVCHSIIRQHEGAVTVDSAPGKGTTVYVYLPAV